MATLRARRACGRLLLTLLALLIPPSVARAVPPGYTVTPVHTGLTFAVAFRFAPDGRLFYLELAGDVWVFDSDTDPTPSLWASIPTERTGERGLLGMAFHPSFPDSPHVYFYHSNPSPLESRVVRMTDQNGVGANYVVLRDGIPGTADHHLGGRLAFGLDGMLWVTYGEQGNPAAARVPSDIRGKLLRLTPMGLDAPGNAFGPGVVMGVRNSFGICFDAVSGKGYFTDNGPDCDDELNLIVPGADYGWGPDDPCDGHPAGTQPALARFTPTIAPTSCLAYRGSATPGLSGGLYFGSYNDGIIRRAWLRSNGTAVDSITIFHQTGSGGVLDMTTGNDGKIWFSTPDVIYRIDPQSPAAVTPGPVGLRELRLAPNPFIESVAISFGGHGPMRVEILDLGGRRVRQWRTSATSVTWDGTDGAGRGVAPGLYLVRASGKDGRVEGRVAHIARR